MAVTQFITHRFAKSVNKTTQLKLRDSVMPGSDEVDFFCSELKNAFHRRAAREYGCFFENSADALLANKLNQWLSTKINFVAMSVQWMQALQSALDELDDIELHGHVVFMQEEHLGDQVFYLYIVSYKDSLLINNRLEVEQSRFVDLGSSLMAARVELSLWRSNASRSYLALAVPRVSNPWTAAFRKLCGFESTIDKKQQTDQFLQTVSAFSMHVPQESVQEFQAQVVDYCLQQDKQGGAVEFDNLSAAVADINGVDGRKFTKTLNKEQQGNEGKVHVDRNSLRKYMRFTGREKDLTVSFTSTQMPGRIQYNGDEDVLTIKGLPDSLRKQLLAYFARSKASG